MNAPIRRRTLLGGAAAVTAAAVTAIPGIASAEGAGSDSSPITGVPKLPAGFDRTFRSRFVNVDGVRLHAVVGGKGRPLLLIPGWPQTWYANRLIMPELARHFQVVAADPRGVGQSDKPSSGYDAGTVATELLGLMRALGHQKFSVFGTDVGMPTGYALAADHRDAVDRLAVAEAPLPGVAPSPPLFLPGALNDHLWHIALNRTAHVGEQLVRGREEIFFGYEFDVQAVRKLPDYATDYYIRVLADDPAALHASFGVYRSLDATIAQNQERAKTKLTIPVLGIGGAGSAGTGPADAMRLAANDVQSAVIPGVGHWVAEEDPQALLAALLPFFDA